MRDNPTPKARALGRKLTAARERAGLTQKQLATALDVSEPFLSRLLSGNRPASSPTNYAVVAGILIGNLTPGYAEREDLRHSLEYLMEEANDAKWIAHQKAERHLQHQAYLYELKHASSAVTVWPMVRPDFYPLPDSGNLTVLAGEAITADRDEADHLGFLGGQGARVHIVAASVIHQHNLDSPFTVLVPCETRRFAYIDGRFTGAFLHKPEDVEPIVSLISTLTSVARPLTPRILTAEASAELGNAVDELSLLQEEVGT